MLFRSNGASAAVPEVSTAELRELQVIIPKFEFSVTLNCECLSLTRMLNFLGKSESFNTGELEIKM